MNDRLVRVPVGIGSVKDLKAIDPKTIPHVLEKGELGLALEWMVTDKNGKVTDHQIKRSESFVQQFIQMLFCCFNCVAYPNTYNVKDTGGVTRASLWGQKYWRGNVIGLDTYAGAGIVTYGIIVGTGNTAPAITDYVLQTPIAHGVGAGQLQYSAMAYGAPAHDTITSQFTLTRNFANGSGGAITVYETGLYCRGYYTDSTVGYFCIVRDVVGAGIAIANGSTLTLNYRPQGAV